MNALKKFQDQQKADFKKRYQVLKDSGLKRDEAYKEIANQEGISWYTTGAIIHNEKYRNTSVKKIIKTVPK